MAKLSIGTGIIPDDGLGDSLLNGAIKINNNFDEIYTYFGDGTNLTFTAFSGDYDDLSNSPINLSEFNNDVGFTTFSGDYDDLSNSPINLSEFNNDVGFTTFSGDYDDLSNSPINLSEFNNDVGFITSFIDTNYWIETSEGIHTLSNVGIGTTNPTTKLDVSGGITATTFFGNLTGTATTAQGLTGTPNIEVGIITATTYNVSGNSSTVDETPITIDASQVQYHSRIASFTASTTVQVSNLTSGRWVQIYIRNINATARTITVQASTTTTGFANVNLAVSTTAGSASAVSFSLAATSGTAVIWVANIDDDIVGSVM